MNCFEAQDNLSSILGQLHESRAFTDTVALRFSWAFVLALTFALACATCPHNSKKQIFTIVTSNKQKFHKNKLCADLLVFTQHRHDMLLLEPTCGSQATRLFRHESVSTSCVVVICSKKRKCFQTVGRKNAYCTLYKRIYKHRHKLSQMSWIAQKQALGKPATSRPCATNGLQLPCASVGLSFWLCLLPSPLS